MKPPKLFLDTNVMLDLLGERVPYYDPIAKIATLAEKSELSMMVSALSYTTVFYILKRYQQADLVLEKLRRFKIISQVCHVDETIIEKALNSNWPDFEDAFQYYCALKANCAVILSRNEKDFKQSQILVTTAAGYLKSIGKR